MCSSRRALAGTESSVCSTSDLIIKCSDVIQLLHQDTVGKCSYSLRKAIKQAKLQYRDKVESQFNGSDTGGESR